MLDSHYEVFTTWNSQHIELQYKDNVTNYTMVMNTFAIKKNI